MAQGNPSRFRRRDKRAPPTRASDPLHFARRLTSKIDRHTQKPREPLRPTGVRALIIWGNKHPYVAGELLRLTRWGPQLRPSKFSPWMDPFVGSGGYARQASPPQLRESDISGRQEVITDKTDKIVSLAVVPHSQLERLYFSHAFACALYRHESGKRKGQQPCRGQGVVF
jgi:hypothetical protein